jgi:hypothetical protein
VSVSVSASTPGTAVTKDTLSWDSDAWGQTLARSPDRSGGAAVALQVDAVTAGQVRVDAIDAGRLPAPSYGG